MDDYKKSLKNNYSDFEQYLKKSINKTEQQKVLEEILLMDEHFKNALSIADFACGGGTLSYHLSDINKNAEFYLFDYLEEALNLAKEININNDRFNYQCADIYKLELNDNTFDTVFCWQTLSWLDNPEKALEELIRVTKKGGKLYLSSLFNTEHDVDSFSKVFDYSGGKTQNNTYSYNTYSSYTIDRWISNLVEDFKIHNFQTSIPFEYKGRGLGTYTKKCNNEYLQISAGMLMNWGILEITK